MPPHNHNERMQHSPDNNNNNNHQQRLAMLSNFSTSYNVVNIALVLPIFRILFPTEHPQQDESFLASSLLVGMMLGQVSGGILGDAIGRLHALRLVMLLQMVASLASAGITQSWNGLAMWRCLLGIGAGGVYPLAAVLSAEQHGSTTTTTTTSNKDEDLHRVVMTFATQGLGFWMVPALGYLLLLTCSNLQIVWRLLLGAGALPGIVLFYWQWKLHRNTTASWEASFPLENNQDETTPRLWQGDTPAEERNTHTTTEDDSDGEETTVLDSTAEPDGLFDESSNLRESQQSWWESVRSEPQLLQKLLGTAATWFLFDVLFYGNTLFQPIVLEAAFGTNQDTNTVAALQQMARNSLILSSIALPGYGVAAYLMGRSDIRFLPSQTPRYVMLQGFACMAILYGVIGVFWETLKRIHPSVLLLLYGLTFFFANYGPNTTTFVLPSMVYSESCRSSLNGLSAAAGKLGAFTGASLFAPAAYQWGNAAVMLICAVVAILSFFLTQACVPSDYHALSRDDEEYLDDELRILDVPLSREGEGEALPTHIGEGVEVQEL